MNILMELLRSYPGGLGELSREAGLSDGALRRFAGSQTVRVPWDVVRLIAQAPGWPDWVAAGTGAAFGFSAAPTQAQLVELFHAGKRHVFDPEQDRRIGQALRDAEESPP